MKHTVCIVGLGYVGLPLAHAVSASGYTMIGFDINKERIDDLNNKIDTTGESSTEDFEGGERIYSYNPSVISEADIVILAIPTPIDNKNKPDLSLLENATRTVGKHIKSGAIIVYESTVYPGVTEDICGKILEEESGMTCGKDFTLGYSPERINPGDTAHTVKTITKVVAGQDEKTLDTLCNFYESFVEAGVHKAPSIRVAEMSKAIENAQRDLNIAFVNEVAMLCNKMDISTKDVLKAAGTKWNFLNFSPGLVGGHCIGVDPYYLVEKAAQLNMETQVITAGRKINDGMGEFVAGQIIKELGSTDKSILVLGLTFKENVPDTRNAKSKDVINTLIKEGYEVCVDDPYVSAEEIDGMGLKSKDEEKKYDAVVLLVPHNEYLKDNLIDLTKEDGMIYDLKSVLDGEKIIKSGRSYKTL